MEKAPLSPPTALTPEQLILTHQDGIWRYLRSLGCDSSLADDLTQDTFVAVIQRDFEQINDAATKSYLRKTALNLFISFQRRKGKVTSVENLEIFDEVWSDWVQDDSGDELIDQLKKCMTRIGDRAQWALQLRFRDKLSRAEIAGHLKITEHGAKNLMQRAKSRLRECIETKLKNEQES